MDSGCCLLNVSEHLTSCETTHSTRMLTVYFHFYSGKSYQLAGQMAITHIMEVINVACSLRLGLRVLVLPNKKKPKIARGSCLQRPRKDSFVPLRT